MTAQFQKRQPFHEKTSVTARPGSFPGGRDFIIKEQYRGRGRGRGRGRIRKRKKNKKKKKTKKAEEKKK